MAQNLQIWPNIGLKMHPLKGNLSNKIISFQFLLPLIKKKNSCPITFDHQIKKKPPWIFFHSVTTANRTVATIAKLSIY